MVLAVLLAHANNAVGQDSLIDEVWAGEPPETAKQTLHSYVSTLRKALGGEIEREGDGYLLKLDRSGLDSLRFEDMVERARRLMADSPPQALSLLQEALGLWRGRAFGDLDGEPALANEVIRLEEARLAALELRIEADLALGNNIAVVQELEALTREYPFRERLRSQLMIALYRSGRQADALRVYQQTRLFLADELGIDPGHELQELEERILDQDPGLDWQAVGGESVRGDRAARGYELRETLGQSAFGTIHRGFQNAVGREVTLLTIDQEIADNPQFVRRFESVMQAISRLEHPHIAPIYDFWRDPDGAYLVIPHLARGSLRGILESGPWNLSSTLRLVDQVSSALTYAHRSGFTHGSLGIDNIVLDEDGNAYVCELGLSEIVDPASAGQKSSAGDVYDLAGVAFTMLAGQPPPAHGRIGETRSDLTDLDHVFQRARHHDPDSRYQKPEDLRRAMRQVAGADVVAANSGSPASIDRRNPYKGLRAFHESDATDFHGRDALVEELVESVAAAQMVTVVGPSGSGKSSLVRAGLIPALRSNGIPGSCTWLVTEMFPGTHPFEELEAALIRVASDRPPGFFEDLTSDPRGLTRAAKQLLPNDEDELVVVIDQFEELFSLVSSESVRGRFLESLIAAATDERSRIRIVLTLRADFFDQPLQYPDFGEVMRVGLVPLSPPTEDGLARAIAQPARDVGVDLEPGLVTRIVNDVEDEPGGLPLMQYALTELFANREHDTLTLSGYNKTGGVIGALGKRAEEIYRHLSDEGKETARHIFLRLVSVDEVADDTRRRVRQTELRDLGLNTAVLDDVLQQFGAFRLLSFDRDAATRTPTVEVAHEALIREWDRLRTWIDERREDLLIHRRIQMTARDWEESGKDPSFLLRGSRLEQALVWQERTDIAISEEEMTYIEAGIETEKRDEAERRALEEKAARRRKAVIGVLAGGLAVAGLLGALALDRASEARITAAEATARDIAASALDAVVEDPELAVLLALESFEPTDHLERAAMPEAISALRNTLPQLRVTGRLSEGDHVMEFSPDGTTIAADRVTGDVSSIAFLDPETGEVQHLLDPPKGATGVIRDLAYSPSGEHLAVVRASSFFAGDADSAPAIDLYEVEGRRHIMTASLTPAFLHSVSFGSGGLLAVTQGDGSSVGSVRVWDTVDDSTVMTQSSEHLRTAQFLPDSEVLVMGHARDPSDSDGLATEQALGTVEAVDVRTDEVIWSFDTEIEPQNTVVSSEGSLLAIADPYASSTVQVLGLPDGEVRSSVTHQDPQGLAWSRDGTMLAVFGNDGDISVFDVGSGERSLLLTGHQAGVTQVGFFPDGNRLASVALDGDPRVWSLGEDTGSQRAVDLDGTPATHSLSPDEDRLFVLMEGSDSGVVNLVTGAIGPTFPVAQRSPLFGAIDSSFTRLAGTDNDDNGRLFDLASGEVILTLDPPCLAPRALSHDARFLLADAISLTDCGGESSRVLDTESGEVVIDLGRREAFTGIFGVTSRGREYVAVNFVETIEVLAIDNGEVLGRLSAEEVGDYVFLTLNLDPTSRYLGIGTNGPRAAVVDMEMVIAGTPMAEALLLNIEAHKGNTPSVNVTSDGVAISAGFDGFYRAWDLETDQKLWEIQVTGLDSPPSSSFDRDETHLIYEDAEGVLRFTPLDTDEVVAQARAAVTRELADDECRQYLHTDGCQD